MGSFAAASISRASKKIIAESELAAKNIPSKNDPLITQNTPQIITQNTAQSDAQTPFIPQPPIFSHCESCGRRLKWWMLLPIFSWLGLRGRCYFCGGKIGIFSLFCELFGAGLFAIIAILGQPLALSATLTGLLMLSFIDAKYQLIPVIWALTTLLFCVIYSGDLMVALAFGGGAVVLREVVGVAMRARGKMAEAMGEGDILLMACVGGLLGTGAGLVAILLAAIMQGILHIFYAIFKKSSQIAFGPSLILGAILGLIFKADFAKIAHFLWQI